MVATLLLAPTTTICLVAGQSGFLLAALLVGGLQLVARRPILAGILFGSLTYKPQFGVLCSCGPRCRRAVALHRCRLRNRSGAHCCYDGGVWWLGLAQLAAGTSFLRSMVRSSYGR